MLATQTLLTLVQKHACGALVLRIRSDSASIMTGR